jgi:hypothetical protein
MPFFWRWMSASTCGFWCCTASEGVAFTSSSHGLRSRQASRQAGPGQRGAGGAWRSRGRPGRCKGVRLPGVVCAGSGSSNGAAAPVAVPHPRRRAPPHPTHLPVLRVNQEVKAQHLKAAVVRRGPQPPGVFSHVRQCGRHRQRGAAQHAAVHRPAAAATRTHAHTHTHTRMSDVPNHTHGAASERVARCWQKHTRTRTHCMHAWRCLIHVAACVHWQLGLVATAHNVGQARHLVSSSGVGESAAATFPACLPAWWPPPLPSTPLGQPAREAVDRRSVTHLKLAWPTWSASILRLHTSPSTFCA